MNVYEVGPFAHLNGIVVGGKEAQSSSYERKIMKERAVSTVLAAHPP